MTDNNKTYGNSFANGLTYFLIGGGIGAVVALLFAPKSGAALRGDIADVSRRGYDATLEKASSLKDQSSEVIQSVKEKAGAAYDFASAKLSSGSDAVNDAVSTAKDSVSDGVEQVRKDADTLSNQFGSGRKSSSIV